MAKKAKKGHEAGAPAPDPTAPPRPDPSAKIEPEPAPPAPEHEAWCDLLKDMGPCNCKVTGHELMKIESANG